MNPEITQLLETIAEQKKEIEFLRSLVEKLTAKPEPKWPDQPPIPNYPTPWWEQFNGPTCKAYARLEADIFCHEQMQKWKKMVGAGLEYA